MSDIAGRVAAVVVDFHAESALSQCVDSLRLNGVRQIVVSTSATGAAPIVAWRG